ncbi:hypothetical protein EJ05DRAFT_358495 [Pseudovirgaria hyperparasitica]|uniref:White collar-2 n=1 Tax=Pseudovirgaria hyperparasitica TaxID=470096 RepID=A0A6A6W7I5_9PEZI|nr:uncharacterized protein EJ05DRAFT_358495 [Pseudovirgaria hyperparasitica]KAF2758593.1 hypothetical protein EJ05DRAFT_358495 [Pseudovirgaria hyperparasitica]
MYHHNGSTMQGDMSGNPSRVMMDDEQGMSMMQSMDNDLLPMDLDLSSLDPDSQSQSVYPYNGHSAAHGSMPHASSTDPGHAFAMHGGNMNDIGAGPLPTGYGMQNPNLSGSTLTEFTKRRNWSQRVLEEIRDFLHILTPDGRILYVSPSAKQLTGYDHGQLLGHFINEYVHPDDSGIYIKEFNEAIASGNSLRFFYRFRKEDGTYVIFESHGHAHLSSEPVALGTHGGHTYCRGFFMMARPYPTKNAALLDSFLEHKIENERLMKRIAELKREEQEENEAADRAYAESKTGPTSTSVSETRTGKRSVSDNMAQYNGMPPPAKPTISNTALTRQNLDEALAASKPDSINDKMARYEGATHIETIEMLTGLHYRDGERAKGISTGDTSPQLIRGDAGIAILVDKDNRGSSDKKKKLKVADEYVCTDCGTLDSPEWRKGPNGPKTLCNACGLRWAKKEKKRHSSNTTPGGQPSSMPMQGSGDSG